MIRSADTAIRTLDVRATRPSSLPRGANFSRSFKSASTSPPPAKVAAPSTVPSQAAPAAGFVRSTSPGHVPRFESVPEAAQWPQGPYKQAPTEFGGEWWLVNPFSGPEPWVRASEIAAGADPAETVQPPDGFLKLFGPRPERSDASSVGEHHLRALLWDRELENFQGVGIPDGYTEEQVQEVTDAFAPWGMGEPVFYKSRDAWVARFPDSLTPEFQISPDTAIKAPQVTVAVYQVRSIHRGLDIGDRHPLVPSEVFPLDRYTLNA